MAFWLAFLCTSALAQTTVPPTNVVMLTVTRGTDNPLGLEHQGWAAYWQAPSAPIHVYGGTLAGVWLPEFSTNNGASWQKTTSHAGQINPREMRATQAWAPTWNWVEASTNEHPNWQVRIRKL